MEQALVCCPFVMAKVVETIGWSTLRLRILINRDNVDVSLQMLTESVIICEKLKNIKQKHMELCMCDGKCI